MITRALPSTVAFLAIASLVASQPAGKWRVTHQTSKMDDSKTVALILKANETISGWPHVTATPELVLRCEEHAVEAYITLGMSAAVESGDTRTVKLRLDKEPAYDVSTSQSTDHHGLFFSAPKAFIQKLAAHQTLVFRFVPFNSNPQETTFDLTGLPDILKELQDACGWNPERDRAQQQAASKKERQEQEAARKQQADDDKARAEEAVHDLAQDRPKYLQERAVRNLKALGPRAASVIPALVEFLKSDGAPELRESVARTLGSMPPTEAPTIVPALMAALQDPSIPVRSAAADGLGRLGPAAKDAVPALTAATTDRQSHISALAQEALDKIQGQAK